MSSDPRIGTRIGPYGIEALIGRGGMGVVYLAEHVHLGRKVALKLLSADLSGDEEFRMRFAREPKLAAALDHPNIIPVYDAGEAEGLLYMAMRYVEGTDLRRVIQAEGPLHPPRALMILGQVADALDTAHEEGLVHRDVKPANILLAPAKRGPPEHVYLTDFGLAKHSASQTGLTRSGYFVGTIHYSAPEQFTDAPVSPRTDVYSLGCVCFESLTGAVPFDRTHDPAVMYAHLQEPPPALTAHRAELPTGADQVIARAMAKNPTDRFETCGDVVQALGDELGVEAATVGPPRAARSGNRTRTIARSDTLATRTEETRPARGAPGRRRLAWAVAATVVVLGAAIATVGIVLLGDGDGPGPGPGPEPVPGLTGRILFARGPSTSGDLYVMDAGATEVTRLTDDPADDGSAVWSPDGTRIAFASNREGEYDIYVMDADGSNVVRLTDSPAVDGFPAWSSDGTKIAFASDRGGDPDVFDVFVMDADGSDQTRLTEDPYDGRSPDWSRVANQIAFSRQRGDDLDIYLMEPDGTDLDPLVTGPSEDGCPAWSPDGSRLAFRSDRDGNGEVYVLDPNGANMANLTMNPADDGCPSWSPDGAMLVFPSDRQGNPDLFVMNADGTEVRALTTGGPQDISPVWGPASS
jgi:serine/threonine-protein kinase